MLPLNLLISETWNIQFPWSGGRDWGGDCDVVGTGAAWLWHLPLHSLKLFLHCLKKLAKQDKNCWLLADLLPLNIREVSGGRQHRVTSRVVAALPEPVSLALPPVLRPRHVIAAHLTSQQALKHGDCQTAWPRPASSLTSHTPSSSHWRSLRASKYFLSPQYPLVQRRCLGQSPWE